MLERRTGRSVGRFTKERINPDLRVGTFEWVSTSSCRLRRTNRNMLAIEILGRIVTSLSDITFTMPTHLDAGGEAASTWYYFYVENLSGVLTPHISVTAPTVDPDAGGVQLVGYHPTSPTWRFIQAVYNGDDSNFVPFDELRDTTCVLRSIAAGSSATYFQTSIGTGLSNTNYTSQTLGTKVPVGISMVRLGTYFAGNDNDIYYARSSLSGSAVASFPTALEIGSVTFANESSGVFDLPVATPATPAFAWGTVDQGTQSISFHYVSVVGWRY